MVERREASPPRGPSAPQDDEGARALTDALRWSFRALKVALVVLFIALALSGTRKVDEGSVAVRLLFGAVYGDPGREVLEPGGPYFWPPEPIGRLVIVPTTQRQVVLDNADAFWFDVPEGSELLSLDQIKPRKSLSPGRDGYLLTADRNIIHGKFTVSYRVDPARALEFIRRVGTGTVRELGAGGEALVRCAARRAIVHVVASVDSDDVVRSILDRERLASEMQSELDRLSSGIVVTRVLVDQPTPPLAVREAFESVTNAVAEKNKRVEEARSRAASTLSKAAGSTSAELLDAIDAVERASSDEPENLRTAEARLFALLDPETSQGEVAERLRNALRFKQETESRIRAEVREFQELHEEYRRNPAIFRNRRWQATLQAILTGDVETFWLPGGDDVDLILEIDRDPRIGKARARDRLRATTGSP